MKRLKIRILKKVLLIILFISIILTPISIFTECLRVNDWTNSTQDEYGSPINDPPTDVISFIEPNQTNQLNISHLHKRNSS